MTDALLVDQQVILAATAPICSVTAVMNLATLHKTTPTRSLLQECQATKTGLIPGQYTPSPEGTDHTPAHYGHIHGKHFS